VSSSNPKRVEVPIQEDMLSVPPKKNIVGGEEGVAKEIQREILIFLLLRAACNISNFS
jgi:hypothetical protein